VTALDVLTAGEALVLLAAESPGALEHVDRFRRFSAGAELNVAIWTAVDHAREAAPGDRARILLELVDQVRDGLDRRVSGDEQWLILALEAGKRGGLFQGDRGVVDDRSAHETKTRDHQRRVPILGVDELGQADGAAGARHILDLHTGGDFFLHQHILHRAGELIVSATGTSRSDDLEALELLRPCRQRRQKAG